MKLIGSTSVLHKIRYMIFKIPYCTHSGIVLRQMPQKSSYCGRRGQFVCVVEYLTIVSTALTKMNYATTGLKKVKELKTLVWHFSREAMKEMSSLKKINSNL